VLYITCRSQTKNEDTQIAERKAERRRKSLNFMSKSAQSDQIREMLENTMDNCLDAFVIEGTAEERLQSVMTKAKQSGMTTESIFSFFNGGNPNTTHITKETFLVALEKLGDTFVIISDEELTGIVEKFDHNKDGQVSIDEFKNYCYEISSVPWKAERMRLERSGELKNLRAQLSRRFTLSDVEDGHSCGEEVYRTSKLFWKTNNNVEIRFFYSTDLNVITVQLYSQTFEEELASIYICRNKIEYQITSLEDEITKALRAGDSPSDDMEEVKRQTTWEVISKYIVARLKLKSHSEIAEDEVPELECAHIPNEASYIPFLCKLTGEMLICLIVNIHNL
jgi:Ca2+-binding EF-hand superfamily protein